MLKRTHFLTTPLIVIFMFSFIQYSCETDKEIPELALYQLTIKVIPENTGKVFGAGNYREGDQINLTAVANNGYQFKNWLDDAGNELSGYVYLDYTMPDGNMTLTAHFAINPDYEQPAGTVTDIDGNEYATVIIGDQEWMAENLKTTRYADGTVIPMLEYDDDWEGTDEGGYNIYPHTIVADIDSEADILQAYGLLYNWYVVSDDRNICPEGWHVPSEDDWKKLEKYLQINHLHGGSLKGTRTEPDDHPRWGYPNADATNETGFSAYPGGIRQMNGDFRLQGENAFFWTSTISTGLPDTDFPEEFSDDVKNSRANPGRKETKPEMAYFRTLYTQNAELHLMNLDKQTEMSIRCIRTRTVKKY